VDKKYGLSIAAHYYNASARWHGTNEAVMTCKHLGEDQRRALVWDIERGKTEAIDPVPWQTDTCIGNWHYNRSIFERHRYKTAAQVVPMLVDIVSKNGNLLLSIPMRGDGTIDSDELEFLRQMADWIKVNGECIYSTRPWKICGEGPALNVNETNRFGGVKDVSKQALTAADIRFTAKEDSLYAIALGWPEDGALRIKSLGTKAGLLDRNIVRISLLGDRRTQFVEHGAEALNQPVQPPALHWIRSTDELTVDLPEERPGNYAWALKITLE
jgi:alpha-L-fucosidase